MFNYGCIIWYTALWQIRLPLLKIWSLRWSKSPPVKQVFWERVYGMLWSISGDRQLTVKQGEAQLWVKRCKNTQSKTSGEPNQVEQIWKTQGGKNRTFKYNKKKINECKLLQKLQLNNVRKTLFDCKSSKFLKCLSPSLLKPSFSSCSCVLTISVCFTN